MSDSTNKNSIDKSSIPRLFVIFNHKLTQVQIEDAFYSLKVSKILEPSQDLRNMWADIPPDADELSNCNEFILLRNWLEINSRTGDYVLIQGEFGATFLMVQFALEKGLVPVYSTTSRKAVEHHNTDGSVEIKHSFSHVKFRNYVY